MSSQRARLQGYRDTYRDGLLEDCLPFWIEHAVDREHGGFLICLDRDGSVLDTDKGLWQQCRFTWLLATLYNEVEAREEWLALARHGVQFIRTHGFDANGRMYFQVTREGRALRQRRYLFTELFGVIALAAYARAAEDSEAADEAIGLFEYCLELRDTPGALEPKQDPTVRASKSIGMPMIVLGTAQVLRETIGALRPRFMDRIEREIQLAIEEIRRDFVKPELEVVMETVGMDGEVLDHFDGRLLNPGHAIEAAWFLMREAQRRDGDADLTELGTRMLDWMWRRGWDEEHGGLYYFRDLDDRPVQEYWHDMKFWWPHNETILATLLAAILTGEERYWEWHERVHTWAFERFPDREHGEWYGYLHRDGRLSVPFKGNLWKGPFHLPRMQLNAWQWLEACLNERALDA